MRNNKIEIKRRQRYAHEKKKLNNAAIFLVQRIAVERMYMVSIWCQYQSVQESLARERKIKCAYYSYINSQFDLIILFSNLYRMFQSLITLFRAMLFTCILFF